MADDCAQPDGADGPHLQLGLHYSLSLQHTHTHTHSHTQRERERHTHGLTVCRWRQFSLKYFNILSFMLNATPVEANCKLSCPANLRPQHGHHFLSTRECFNMYKKLPSKHATTKCVYTAFNQKHFVYIYEHSLNFLNSLT